MVLKKLTPNLMVEDVNSTVQFYQEVLGAIVIATVPESGQFDWAMVQIGEVSLMFESRQSLSRDLPVFKDMTLGGALTFYVDAGDFTELYTQISTKAEILREPHVTFYGRREFVFKDCNGFCFTISEEATQSG